MARPDDIDPTVRRLLGESNAHTGEARRRLAEIERSKRAAVDAEEFEEEITGVHERLNLLEQRVTQPSVGEFELHGPAGIRARLTGLGGWHLVAAVCGVTVIVLALLAMWVFR